MVIVSPGSYSDWPSVVYVTTQDAVVVYKYMQLIICQKNPTVFMKHEDLS